MDGAPDHVEEERTTDPERAIHGTAEGVPLTKLQVVTRCTNYCEGGMTPSG